MAIDGQYLRLQVGTDCRSIPCQASGVIEAMGVLLPEGRVERYRAITWEPGDLRFFSEIK